LAVLATERPGWASTPRSQIFLGLLTLALVAAVTAAPVVLVVVGALERNLWRAVFIDSTINRSAIAYSFFLALRAPVAAVIGFLVAWLLIRVRVPGSRFIEFALWTTFFVPVLPVTLSWILLLSPSYGLINQIAKTLPFVTSAPFNIYSVGGILWVQVLTSSIPVMVVLLAPALRQLDSSFEEVGRVCGAKPFTVFRQVTLPILAPAILTGALAGFIKSLETFEVERILGQPSNIWVYSTRIYDLVSLEPPNFQAAMSLSTFIMFFLLLIAIVYQRVSLRFDYATILGRGTRFEPLRLGRSRYFISAALFLLVAVSLAFPLFMLVVGSCMKLFGFFTIPSPFSLVHWAEVLNDPLFAKALRNSLLVAGGAGIGGVLIYAGLAQIVRRSRLPGRHAVELLTWLPWAIPGILLGISMLWIILTVPALSAVLYGTLLSLILIIVIAQMPIGVHMIKTSIGQISRELEQSSRVSGAGPFTTFARIVLPLVSPMLVSIFVIVFISALRDISTTIFLANGNSQTLSLLMMQFALSSNLEGAAVIGAITTSIILVVAFAARHYGLQLLGQK
jgi:iron(III) transport system permease protein